jgi:hypothetical protein
VADRGRISAGVLAAYAAAHQDRRPTEAPVGEVEDPAPPVGDDPEVIGEPGLSPQAWASAPAQAGPDWPGAGWAPPSPPEWTKPSAQPGSEGPPAGWAPPSPTYEWDPAPLPTPDPSKGPDGYAIASLVLGLLPIMCGLFAIVFGIVALGRIRLSQRPGRGLAIAGIVLGICWFLGFLAAVLLRVLIGSDAYS